MRLRNAFLTYILIGIHNNENFTYARAALIPSLKISLLVKSKAQEIKCTEILDHEYTLDLNELGTIKINSLCVADIIAIFDGRRKLRLVLYIVEDNVLRRIACEAILGADALQLLELLYGTIK
ncbi:MAG: hypothetical protein QXL96_04120 [Ignisphaera sp.]